MKLTNAIKKIEKHVGPLTQNDRGQYYVCHNAYVLSFYAQDDQVHNFHVRREDDHTDTQTDYFAGYYVTSAKSAIAAVTVEAVESAKRCFRYAIENLATLEARDDTTPERLARAVASVAATQIRVESCGLDSIDVLAA